MGGYAKARKKGTTAPLPYPEAVEDESSGGHSVLGFFGNVVGDALDMGKGLGTLGYNLTKDALGETAEGLSFGHYNYSSKTDDMLKAAPSAIAEDYKQRYGSKEGFVEGLYEDPLSFANDVFTVATLGGAAAAKAAGAASRIGGVSDDLARLGAGAEAADVGKVAGIVDKILPGAKLRALGQDVPLGGTAEAMNQVTGAAKILDLPANPVRRAIQETRFNLRTRGIEDLQKQLGVLDDALSDATDATQVTKLRAEQARVQGMLNHARSEGPSRVLSARASMKDVDRLAKRVVNESGSNFIGTRDRFIRAHRELFARLPKEDLDGLHLKLQGITEHPSQGRVLFDDLESMLGADTPRAARVAEVIQPHIERIREMETRLSPRPKEGLVRLWRGENPYTPEDIATRMPGRYAEQDRGLWFSESEQYARSWASQGGPQGSGQVKYIDITPAEYEQMLEVNVYGVDLPLRDVNEIVIPREWEQRIRRDPLQEMAESPLGARVTSQYLDDLSKSGRFQDLRPFQSRFDNLTPEEHLALQQEVQVAAATEIEAGRRLTEIVAGEPLAASRTGIVDDVADVIDDERLVNLSQEANHLLETGGDYKTLFERLYGPERARIASEMLENGEVSSLMEGLERAPSAFDLDDARLARGVKAPAYYPHYESLRAKNSHYLQSKRRTGMGRQSNVSKFKRSNQRLMSEYLRGTKDAYLTNPDDAYGLLAAEVANHTEAAKLIDELKNEFGVLVKAEDELPPGWAVINPDSQKLLIRRSLEVRTKAAEELKNGADPISAYQRGVKDAFLGKEEDIAELLRSRSEVYAVPQIVAERLEDAMKYTLGAKSEARVRVWFDGPTNLWRNTTLYLRPGFYVNNIGGNSVFLGLQGGVRSIAHMVRQLDGKYRASTLRVIKELNAEDAVGGGFYSEALQRSRNLTPAMNSDLPITGRVARFAGRRQESTVGRVTSKGIDRARRLNSVFEDAARKESFLTAAEKDLAERGIKKAGKLFIRDEKRLEQILTYGIDDPRAVSRWVDGMNETMNNYLAQGTFSRKVWRRFAQPFWPFFRHAARTLLTMPYKHPGKAKLFQLVNVVDEEFKADQGLDDVEDIAPWLEGAFPIGAGGEPGETRFFGTKAVNPFGGLGGSPLGQLGPIPKMALETLLGRDLYTGDKFTMPGVETPYGSEQAYRMGPNGPEPYTVRPAIENFPFGLVEQAAQQFPQYDLLRDLTSGGARYDTGETMTNPDGTPRYPIDPLQEVAKFLGFPTYDVDLDELRARKAKERASALDLLLSP